MVKTHRHKSCMYMHACGSVSIVQMMVSRLGLVVKTHRHKSCMYACMRICIYTINLGGPTWPGGMALGPIACEPVSIV